MICVWPGVQPVRRVKHMLHAMITTGREGSSERHNALYPQEARAMRLPKQVQKHVESRRRQWRFAGKAKGADVVVMAVYVMVMMMVMAIIRRFDALRVQPLRDARDFPVGS